MRIKKIKTNKNKLRKLKCDWTFTPIQEYFYDLDLEDEIKSVWFDDNKSKFQKFLDNLFSTEQFFFS